VDDGTGRDERWAAIDLRASAVIAFLRRRS